MGEYADLMLSAEMRRGRKEPPRRDTPYPKSSVGGHCPICGKEIRTIRGRIEESLSQHMNAKHKGSAP